MARIKYIIALSEEEGEYLKGLTSRGKTQVRQIKRAQTLLKANEGLEDKEIAKAVGTSLSTVHRTRKRFVEEGLEALKERPRSGRLPEIGGRQQAHIIATACSDPPEGHARWSLRLLAHKVVELEIVESISHEEVRKLLKKTNLSLGRRSNGASRR